MYTLQTIGNDETDYPQPIAPNVYYFRFANGDGWQPQGGDETFAAPLINMRLVSDQPLDKVKNYGQELSCVQAAGVIADVETFVASTNGKRNAPTLTSNKIALPYEAGLVQHMRNCVRYFLEESNAVKADIYQAQPGSEGISCDDEIIYRNAKPTLYFLTGTANSFKLVLNLYDSVFNQPQDSLKFPAYTLDKFTAAKAEGRRLYAVIHC